MLLFVMRIFWLECDYAKMLNEKGGKQPERKYSQHKVSFGGWVTGDFFLLLLCKISIFRTHNFFSFLTCNAAAIIPNSQGYSKDEMRLCMKQAEPKSCGHWTVRQPGLLTHQLSDLWAQLPFRPRIKVMLREVVLINYSCHLWIVEATNAKTHRSQE